MADSRCFICGGKVVWQSDFTFEDFGIEGEGIVYICKCSKCGAEYEIYTAIGEENEC